MLFSLDQIGVEDNFFVTVHIEIIYGNIINRDGAELCDSDDIAVDNCVSSNFFTGFTVHPLFKHLSRLKRSLRHHFNGLTLSPEKLLQRLPDRTIVVQDLELDTVHVLELRGKRKILLDLFAALVLGFSIKPAKEFLAFDHGIRRQAQGVASVISVCLVNQRLVLFIQRHESDREHILLILRPYGKRSGSLSLVLHRNCVVEVASSIDPLSTASGYFRHTGDIIQAIGSIGSNRSGVDYLGLIFIAIESNGIFNLSIVRNNLCVSRRRIRSINTGTKHMDFLPLAARNNLTDCPVGIIILTRDDTRELIADGMALINLCRGINLCITVIEGNSPDCDPICGQRDICRHGIR